MELVLDKIEAGEYVNNEIYTPYSQNEEQYLKWLEGEKQKSEQFKKDCFAENNIVDEVKAEIIWLHLISKFGKAELEEIASEFYHLIKLMTKLEIRVGA